MKFTLPAAFCQFLTALNLPVDELLAEAHLTEAVKNGELKLSPLEYYQLIAAVEPYLTTQDVLRICEVANMQQFATPVYAALVAENGLAALQRVATYKHLIGPVTMTITDQGTTVEVRYRFIYPELAQLKLAVLFEQLLAVNILRAGSQQQIVPLVVASRFDYDSAFTAHFGCAGTRRDGNCLIFAKEDVQLPFTSADERISAILSPILRAQLTASDGDDPLMAAVQQQLVTNLARADDRLVSVGNQLGMSPRSLQREFARRHTSYKQVLAHAKRMLAINYAQNLHLPLVEIAYLLGYSEPSAFSRAFRQWTGMSFSGYQQAQASS